ncbi:argininosuccinate lyase [Priestia megaterium]|uniref:argininosuccinate lyase n=1 Tax=Priestia megaterium TaxID=1404 RepID=UPI00272F9B65|nr:argininosuccinate lyase [Priestia megaterium]MDP1442122.1 argininosuccinate lyase [Priestia megaterium]MDP1471101.1 argininosuccinate lyase [Priestia megaterium]
MRLPETYNEIRNMVFAEEGNKYPGRALVQMELNPGYERAKTRLLPHIRTINEAHLIMLAEQEIITHEDAKRIMEVLLQIDYDAYRNSSYSGQFEDLYFQMEDEIVRKTDGIGGNLHLARSRNDMCLAWSRMVVREELLLLIKCLVGLQNTVTLFAEEHRETLYVIHTHTQHAQPSFLGHYFLGIVDVLDRNIARLQHAYQAANSSPMGAAAITTSAFPISRHRVAELAGFESVIENSYDAIGNCDYYSQTASAISLCALDLGRIITDMLLWATEELKMIRVADGYISTSSIMPQKRNPIALEHLRASLSVVKGLADTVLGVFFKAPYGDISDYEDIEDTMSSAMELLNKNLELFNAVIATMDVDKKLLADRAYESFSVVTEIADEVYRSYHIPFRKAHHFVAQLVKKADQMNYNLKNISHEFFAQVYLEVFGQPFKEDFTPILKSIDPKNFVKERNVYGGSGPKAMADMFSTANEKISRNLKWYKSKVEMLEDVQNKREQEIKKIINYNLKKERCEFS